jgi:ribosome-associated protein
MAGSLPVTSHLAVPLSELSWRVARSSGPGGQNINKVNSKVILRWKPAETAGLPADVVTRFLSRYRARLTESGELIVACDRFRDQPKNRADCLERLAAMIRAVARPPKPRRPSKPTAGSQRRRLADKRLRSEKKARRQSPEE